MTRALAVAADIGSGPDRLLSEMLVPALTAAGRAASPYRHSLLGSWAHEGLDRVHLVEPDRADIAVLPFALEAVDAYPELWAEAGHAAVRAERAGLVLLAFCHGDRYVPAPGPRCVVFRTHLEAASAGPHDVALPAWVTDPQAQAALSARGYRSRPDVGFTGYAHPLGTGAGAASWARFGLRCAATAAGVEDLLKIPGADPTRVLALMALRWSHHVDLAETLRPTMTRLDLDRAEDGDRHREMLKDVAAHDYGLAVRGLGNFSYRLYEVLAAGRRPLMIDSGAVLPRARAVAWDRLVVRVPRGRIARAGRQLAVQHGALDASSWALLQAECRASWLRHLSVAGFLGNVVDQVLAQLEGRSPGQLQPAALAAALR